MNTAAFNACHGSPGILANDDLPVCKWYRGHIDLGELRLVYEGCTSDGEFELYGVVSMRRMLSGVETKDESACRFALAVVEAALKLGGQTLDELILENRDTDGEVELYA